MLGLRRRSILISGLILLILAACAGPDTQPSPSTELPTLSSKPTASSIPTTSPTATANPTTTPTPTRISPPPLPDALLNDIVFSGISEDCQLPCWHDLVIGESGRDDVQRLFDEVFGFAGMIDFFDENPLDGVDPRMIGVDVVRGLEVTGNYWSMGTEERGGLVDVYVWMDEQTGKLAGIQVYWASTGDAFNTYAPAELIQSLGPPAIFFISPVSLMEIGGIGAIDMLLIYDTGVSFRFFKTIPIESTLNDNIVDETAILCLGEVINSGEMSITYPLQRLGGEYSPLHLPWISDVIEFRDMVSIESNFNTTLEQIATSPTQCLESLLYQHPLPQDD